MTIQGVQEAPRLIEVPLRLDAIITRAVWDFAEKNPPWEAHARYHDEPIWILRREDKDGVRRVQIALFAQADEVHLYLIPDRSNLADEDRMRFRRDCQIDVPYKELLGYTAKDIVVKLDTIVKKYLS